jgi:hypothetical protein
VGLSNASDAVGTWVHAVRFWDYLTQTRSLNVGHVFCPSQYGCNGVTQIPHFYDGNVSDPGNQNTNWAEHLKSNVKAGDIVFYRFNDEFGNPSASRWDHVAIVTEEQMYQTLYNKDHNTITPTPEPPQQPYSWAYPFKPRVLEHSGNIMTDGSGRSIDNTVNTINEISIVRIPSNINQMPTH